MEAIRTRSVGTASQDALVDQHRKNLDLIERIKQEVAQEHDNLNNPIPFLNQIGNAPQ